MDFHRIMLLGIETNERVTVDVDLQVGTDDRLQALGDLVVIEVKQSPFSTGTPAMRALWGAGLRALSMSKYVVALAQTRPELRMHGFSPICALPSSRRRP
jgi:hypothetical protein